MKKFRKGSIPVLHLIGYLYKYHSSNLNRKYLLSTLYIFFLLHFIIFIFVQLSRLLEYRARNLKKWIRFPRLVLRNKSF